MLGKSISNYTASQNATHLILEIHKAWKWNRFVPFHSICPFLPYCDRPPPLCVHCARPREAAQTTAVDGHRRRSKLRSCSLVTKQLLLFACVILWSTFHCRRWLCRHFSSCCWRKRRFRFSVFFPERRVTIIKVVIPSVVTSKKKRSLLCVSIWKVTQKKKNWFDHFSKRSTR